MSTDTAVKFPNFLVIGAAKSGTYTLNEYFAGHPQVFMCPNKEPHFFAFGHESLNIKPGAGGPVHDCVRSIDEYLRLFADAGDVRMAGECSVSYLYWPGTAERIHQFNPDMRLIVSLRHPVGRAYSSFNYAKSYGIEPLQSLSEGFQAEPERIAQNQSLLLRYRDLGMYAAQLERYYKIFPRDQIKVILFEELTNNPVDTVRGLFEFIGVDPDVELSPAVHVNATTVPDESNPWHRLISGDHWARAAVRKLLPVHFREGMRNAARRAFSKRPPRLDSEERERLLSLFSEDIQRLEDIIQRDLSAWKE